MIARSITDRLLKALAYSPVVLIMGPRQAGKSTLANSLFDLDKAATFESLDIATTRAAAVQDPDGFVAQLELPAVIDEVQKAPDLFDAIKAHVDRKRTAGSFILTGSANVLLLPAISESLTGRVELITLWPLSQGELMGTRERFIDTVFKETSPKLNVEPLERPALINMLLRGGFPEALSRPFDALQDWFESYTSTAVTRDVRDLADIGRIDALPGLLLSIGSRVRAPINKSAIGGELGLPTTTIDRYIALLERGYLIHRVPAYSKNIGKRLAKAPKYLLADSGMLAYLLNLDANRLQNSASELGVLLENFVGMELAKQLTWSSTKATLNHLRAARGAEIDFVLATRDGQVVGIEVKAAGTAHKEDFKHLEMLRDRLGDQFVRGVVLYTGEVRAGFGDRLEAWPLPALWSSSTVGSRQ